MKLFNHRCPLKSCKLYQDDAATCNAPHKDMLEYCGVYRHWKAQRRTGRC